MDRTGPVWRWIGRLAGSCGWRASNNGAWAGTVNVEMVGRECIKDIFGDRVHWTYWSVRCEGEKRESTVTPRVWATTWRWVPFTKTKKVWRGPVHGSVLVLLRLCCLLDIQVWGNKSGIWFWNLGERSGLVIKIWVLSQHLASLKLVYEVLQDLVGLPVRS